MEVGNNEIIYWSSINFNDWNFYLAKSKIGLCYIGSPNQAFYEMEQFVQKHYSNFHLEENNQQLRVEIEELLNFLNGKSKEFNIHVDLKGTKFQHEVWNELIKIPFGETWSYQKLAESMGRPTAVRAVGSAIGANPVLVAIPCHRVIGKNGKLTGYRGGLEMKEYLLKLEGA